MDLKQQFEKETNKSVNGGVIEILLMKQYSEDYVNWLEAKINYTRCCCKLSKDRLEQAIEKAKPNLDKIKDVDKHLDSIR